ncbi:M17 family metallopeptidase [Fangia hongkongensis]|uniref:M17 family metallopeptidase n=3 Tax=Fangia hongkongensis TaxID=270495 RepID=UPI000367B2EF|nr:leucyl aminopeptidase family protein [Fangia hongkongensis]
MLQALTGPRLNFIHSIEDHEQYDLIIAANNQENSLQSLPFGDVLIERIQANNIKLKKGYLSSLPNRKGTQIILVENTDNKDVYIWLSQLSKLLSKIDLIGAKKIALFLEDASEKTANQIVRTILAHTHNMPNYQRKPDTIKVDIDIIGDYVEADFLEVLAKDKGNALARYLTILPTNYLTPEIYIDEVKKLAQSENWQCEVYDKNALKEMGAGAFSAVANASDHAAIVKLSYFPEDQSSKQLISFVGKGVCFDTGGVSIKPPQYMHGMNDDMMGSAVALGTFLALSMQQVPIKMECYLAITQNNIDKDAFLPNEVVRALNGKTIEVVDTDAEGRMALADALVLACRSKPDLLIDYATLTGAAVRALGTEYAAIFSNHYDWQDKLVNYGINSGEKVWPFPMDKHYLNELKSEVADLKQCNVTGNADHILAAKFLQQFVNKEVRWLHMDLASCKHKGGLGAIPTEVSGVGVWFSSELITQYIFANAN